MNDRDKVVLPGMPENITDGPAADRYLKQAKKSKTKKSVPSAMYALSIDVKQLTHLRDMLSILLPDGSTVSRTLADAHGTLDAEDDLWKKLVELCRSAGIGLDNEAPDLMVHLTQEPVLGIVSVNVNPKQG